MMKSSAILAGMLMMASISAAQNYNREINDQVWRPFITSFNAFDAEGFLEVHSKDIVRSPRDAKKIYNWSAYLEAQSAGDKRSKQAGSRRTLDLRFTERIATKDHAVEVGIYKTSITDAGGITRVYYGRFHVVLRREEGKWKILVDTDSTENNTVAEKDFLAASPM